MSFIAPTNGTAHPLMPATVNQRRNTAQLPAQPVQAVAQTILVSSLPNQPVQIVLQTAQPMQPVQTVVVQTLPLPQPMPPLHGRGRARPPALHLVPPHPVFDEAKVNIRVGAQGGRGQIRAKVMQQPHSSTSGQPVFKQPNTR